jgi:hypothetical protein
VKVGQKQGKKEKKKETQFRSLPYPIKARETQTIVSGFPTHDKLRDKQAPEKPKVIGP